MRAKEFIPEDAPEGLVIKHKPTPTGGAAVEAYIGNREVGFVQFQRQRDGNYKAAMAHVSPTMRKQGIGREMYRYARNVLGFNIVPSDSQSDDAQAFWSRGGATNEEQGVAEDSFSQNFNQIDSIITKKYPKKIMNLLLGMFPAAKEAVVNQYNDEDGMPFAEWRRAIWDIGNYVLSGPVVINGSKLPIDSETEADRLAKYQQYIQDKDSGKPARYFRNNDADPRTIDFTKLPPITLAQTDAGMAVTDGNHRAFLAKMANKPLRAYVWKRQLNNHPNVAKIKALFSNTAQGPITVSEGQRQHLDFDKIYGRYLKVTDNDGDPNKEGFSLVTPLNGASWNWRERPEFKNIVKQNLNRPGWLGDYKYQQIIDAMAGKEFDPAQHLAKENFADGRVKGKSRPGRVKRAGASCAGSVTDLRKRAKKYSGERAKMYHWCANMKSGKRKK